MNSSTRTLVYSSIIFAVTSLCAYADPIRGRPNETVTPTDTFRTTGTLVLGSDITQSSLSDGERLVVKNSFSNTRSGPLDMVAMFTPSTGKVASFDRAPGLPTSSSPQNKVADISTTDSIAFTHSDATSYSTTVTPDRTDQLVSDASAAVSGVVDSDNLSVSTTATATTSEVSPAASISQDNFDPQPASSTPEPSSILMAGSIFFGWGLFTTLRRKRA